jgi:hypothetical protein
MTDPTGKSGKKLQPETSGTLTAQSASSRSLQAVAVPGLPGARGFGVSAQISLITENRIRVTVSGRASRGKYATGGYAVNHDGALVTEGEIVLPDTGDAKSFDYTCQPGSWRAAIWAWQGSIPAKDEIVVAIAESDCAEKQTNRWWTWKLLKPRVPILVPNSTPAPAPHPLPEPTPVPGILIGAL